MVEVCAGNFAENVYVLNTMDGLQIVGEEAVTLRCPQYGSGSGFDLFASGVTIQGFDISNCASAISVEYQVGGERFTQNTIHNNGIGISFNTSSGDNTVVNNAIYYNSGDGVFDYSAKGDYITSNTVQGNGGNGIEISTSFCSPATVVSGNEAVGNSSNGVYLNTDQCVNVKQNTLLSNGNDGLDLNATMQSVVTANDAAGNRNDGIELSSSSIHDSIVNNTMQMNRAFDAGDHSSGGTNLWTGDHCKTTSGAAVCVQ
jgi:hypothetical protein